MSAIKPTSEQLFGMLRVIVAAAIGAATSTAAVITWADNRFMTREVADERYVTPEQADQRYVLLTVNAQATRRVDEQISRLATIVESTNMESGQARDRLSRLETKMDILINATVQPRQR